MQSQQAQSTHRWPKLRGDLDRVRTRDDNGLVNTVIDPVSGDAFEFGEEEGFLLQCLDGSTGAQDTLRQFREKFNLDITPDQLDDFVDMVRGWHLLDEPGAVDAAAARNRKLPALRPRPTESLDQDPGAGFDPSGDDASGPGGGGPPADEGIDFDMDMDADMHLEMDMDMGIGMGPGAAGAGGAGGAGGARSGGMGGGRGGARGGARAGGRRADTGGVRTDDDAASAESEIWSWFNPDAGFAALAGALRPLRYLRWLVPVLALGGLAGLFNNLDVFVSDFSNFRAPLSIAQNLLFSMITVNLLGQFMSGVVARGVGVPVTAFGIRMVFGVIPRFAIETGDVDRLDVGSRYWFYGGPLLVRASLFGVSVVFWLSSRGGGTALPVFLLLLIVTSIISFVLMCNPLHKGSGYGLLKTVVDMPNLRQQAFMALFRGKGRRGGANEENKTALKFYALASLIFIVAVAGVVLTFTARWLEFNYQGTGVSLFILLVLFLFLRFRSQLRKKAETRRARAGARGGPGQGRRGVREGQLVARGESLPGRGAHARSPARAGHPMGHAGARPQKSARRWPRYVLGAVVLVVMFLPYPYETGGPLQILPTERQELTAETSGVIAEVLYRGGESLERGTYIAKLSSSEQEKNVSTTRAAILEQQARLDELLNLPRPEDVTLARQRLQTARTKAGFSIESAARMEKLYGTGTISLDDYETARRAMEVDKAQVVEEQANLARVMGGAHPQEIEAARYELQRLEEQLKFYDRELGITRFVMPFDGRLVTMNLSQSMGQYLNKGEVFAVVENDTLLRVEVNIPESDISEISVGGKTRIKIWAYPDRIFVGKVTEVSPVVEEDTFGRIVTVTTMIDNEEGLLKTGMTGFGKIEGGTKPVIVAFTRMLVRFFSIEIWSWIP